MRVAGSRGALVRVLAWRRLTARPLRSGVTAAGVAIGVAFLFSILSLNAQLVSTAHETAALLDRPRLLQVLPAGPGGLPEELAGQLASDPRVEASAPLLVTRAKMANGARETGAFVLAGTLDFAALVPAESMPSMDDVQLAGDGDLILSRGLADRLRVGAGDDLTLHATTGKTALRVAGVLPASDIDRVNGGIVAAMPLARAQEVFARAGRIDQVMVLATPDADLQALTRDIEKTIGGVGIVGSPGSAAGDSFNFEFMRVFTNSVGAFMVMAALMLVFHTMSTAAAERRTEIALARSLGSSRRQLLTVTLVEAGLLGVVGTVVGLLVGAALARLVVPLTRYMYALGSPVDLPTDVAIQTGPAVVAAVAGIAGAVVGAVLPARSASRAAPIDAFRPTANYEWRDTTRPRYERARVAVGLVVLAFGIGLPLGRPADDPADLAVMIPVLAVYLAAGILVPVAVPWAARGAASLLARSSTTTGRLAADALRNNPRRTTINVMALLIPVAAVALTAVSFESGMTGITRVARGVVGAPLNVDADSYVGVLGGSVASQPLAPGHRAVLERVPGVRAALPYQNANIRLPEGGAGILYAIPLGAGARAGVSDMVRFASLADDPAAFERGLAAGDVAASRSAARKLGLRSGGSVTLPTPAGPRSFRVAALFDDWTFEGTFAIDLDHYRAIWGDEAAHRYAIVPTPDTSLTDLAVRLEAAVADAAMPAQVHTRDDAVAELEANTSIFQPLARGMTLASLLFAALALGNAAFTAVTEQRWNLALQRTLGMSRRRMTRSLALEAATVGVIGAVGGAIVGTGSGAFSARMLAYQVALEIDYAVPWRLVALATVLGIVVAVTATHYPRRVAKRVPIIEALRFE